MTEKPDFGSLSDFYVIIDIAALMHKEITH